MRNFSKFLFLFVLGLQAQWVYLQEDRNVYDIIKENKDLSEFSEILLLDGLHKAFLDRAVTIFVPNNAAMRRYRGRRNENLILNHMTNVAIFSEQLRDRLSSLMTGSPPLYATRRQRSGNATGIFVNQAQIIFPDITARSPRGDQQVLHILDSVLEPLVPTSLREAEYFVQLDAKKLLTKSTLYDLGNERLKVFYDQAELNARTQMFGVSGQHTFFFPVDSAFDVSVPLNGYDYERGRPTGLSRMGSIRKELLDGRVIEAHIVPHKLLFTSQAPTLEFPTVAWLPDGIQVNVSLQPTSFQNSDDVTIINTNNKHTYNRNNFEHEDWVGGPDEIKIMNDRDRAVMVRSNTIVGDRAHPRGMVVSRIVRGNIPVQNGVVHLIDKPLMIVARTLYEYILEEGREPNNRLSMFSKMLRDKGGLFAEALLEAKDGTLLAPSDEAFLKVDRERLDYILGSDYLRAEMLGLHFVRERIISTDYKIQANGDIAYSAPASLAHNRVWFHFKPREQLMTASARGINATILEKDIGTINGVIHVIDRVLGVPYEDCGQMMDNNPDMSHMWSMIRQLRIESAFSSPTSRGGWLTVVVPSNSAWEKAQRDFSQAYATLTQGDEPQYAKTIIERHVRIGDRAVTFEELVEMSRRSPRRTVEMVKGELMFTQLGEFHLNAYKDNFVAWNEIQAKVIRPNMECTNGYIHLVDTVMIDDMPPWAVGRASWISTNCGLFVVLFALQRFL